jgi:hypothetical protein
MALFKTNPAAALDEEQAALLQVDSSIVRLENERATLIASDSGDVVAGVLKIDAELGKQRAASDVRRARIAALRDKQQQHIRAARAQAKREWLADIAKRFDRAIAAAAKFDRDVDQAKSSHAELAASLKEVLALPCHDFLPKGKDDGYLLTLLTVLELPKLPVAGDFASRAKEKRRLLLEFLDETPIPETDLEPVVAA